MTKPQLVAFAAALSLVGAGVWRWNTGTSTLDQNWPPGGIEILNRADCTVAACNAPLCLAANNHLADAGSSCVTELATCPTRIGAYGRAWLADAGFTVPTQRYVRARLVGLKCPAVGGGFAHAPPVDDGGVPMFASFAQVVPPCRRRDGGDLPNCHSVFWDGGSATDYSDTGNVMQPGAFVDPGGCEAVECAVMAGDHPETDL